MVKNNPYKVATLVLAVFLAVGLITGFIILGNNKSPVTIEDKEDFCFSSQMSDAEDVCRAHGCNGGARYFNLQHKGASSSGYKVVLNCKNTDDSDCLSLVWDNSMQIH